MNLDVSVSVLDGHFVIRVEVSSFLSLILHYAWTVKSERVHPSITHCLP